MEDSHIIVFLAFLYLLLRQLMIKCLRKKPCEPSGSGSGGSGCNARYPSLRLVRTSGIIGQGFHRSGWQYVVSKLAIFNTAEGILFDDFVEQNFCYTPEPIIYKEEWAGIFHHPPDIPYFGNSREHMDVMLRSEAFQASLPKLRLAIALSEHHARALRKRLPKTVPVIALKHPAAQGFPEWSETVFKQKQTILQIGYYLRNTQLINQFECVETRKRLWLQKKWIEEYDARVIQYWKQQSDRNFFPPAKNLNFQPPSAFDRLLTESVVVAEYFACSASNGILDCMVRNTPIIVNKHPAIVEYLGEDYPLYFKHPSEIPALIDKAKEGHLYLKTMDKSWLCPEQFARQVMQAVESIT